MGGQVRVHGGRGWGPRPPLEIGKKEAVRGNFNLFHLYRPPPPPYEFLDMHLHGGIRLANMVMGDLRTLVRWGIDKRNIFVL